MAVTKDNVLFFYRDGDSDSEAIAEQYKDIHGLNSDQIVAIPCSNVEILSDYSTFQTEVESPISTELSSTSYDVLAIVLGYKVPGGFQDGIDVISSTSRISRIDHAFNKQTNNVLYDRKTFRNFDVADAAFAYICTRIDGPTFTIVEDWLRLSEVAKSTQTVSGKFYLDAYSGIGGTLAEAYTDELIDFGVSLLTDLGLDVVSTSFIDPYIDALFIRLEDDSFNWGWGADDGSLSFFSNTSTLRAFYYNADFDGASTVRDIDSRGWAMLAIRSGYVGSAGSTSNPGVDGFMRPFPFFNALFRGATLGEAMTYATPYLDWTVAHFGDPLLRFVFPNDASSLELIEEDKAWQLIEESIAESVAWIWRKGELYEEIRDRVVAGCDVQSAADLLYVFDRSYNYFGNTGWKTDFINLTRDLITFSLQRNQYRFQDFTDPSFNDYLDLTGNKVHGLLMETLQDNVFFQGIDEDNFFEEGTWFIEFPLVHDTLDVSIYDFQLQVSEIADFSEVALSADSNLGLSGWSFENDSGTFSELPSNGISSNFAGRIIRYDNQEDEKLTRSNVYFFRIRQFDGVGFTEWQVVEKIIFT